VAGPVTPGEIIGEVEGAVIGGEIVDGPVMPGESVGEVDGAVIDGDPTHVGDVTDIWTFERDVNSRDPNWKLVATESVE